MSETIYATAPVGALRHRFSTRSAVAWGVAALLVFFALFASVLANADAPWFVGLDRSWHDVLAGVRSGPMNAIEIGVDIATGGPIGGSVILIVPIIVLLIMRRWWSALYYGLGAFAAGALSQIAKQIVARERPTDGLWHVDFGSFPSGHLTGFAFFIIAVCILVARRWVTVIGVILLVHELFNRTYLAAHWLSDTFAGLTLGASVAFLLWAAFRRLIVRQNERFAKRG